MKTKAKKVAPKKGAKAKAARRWKPEPQFMAFMSALHTASNKAVDALIEGAVERDQPALAALLKANRDWITGTMGFILYVAMAGKTP